MFRAPPRLSFIAGVATIEHRIATYHPERVFFGHVLTMCCPRQDSNVDYRGHGATAARPAGELQVLWACPASGASGWSADLGRLRFLVARRR